MLTTDSYKEVFNVSNGYSEWWILALALGSSILAIFVTQLSKLTSIVMPETTRLNTRLAMSPSDFSTVLAIVSFLFLLIGGGIFAKTYHDYLVDCSIMSSDQANYVEGAVQDFTPGSPTNHGNESFSVKGIFFHYSDAIITPSFHVTILNGGPIRQGLPVRIWYSGNDILKLEIKNESP